MVDLERTNPASEASPEEELAYLLAEASERMQVGRLEEARAHLERALTVCPGHERARNLLGLSLFRMGELGDAEAILQELVDDNPVEPSLRLNLAMVLLKANRLEDARVELIRVLDLNPEHTRAAGFMGLVLERLEDFAEAAVWYARAGQAQRAEELASRAAEGEATHASGVPAPPPLSEAPPALGSAAKSGGDLPILPALDDGGIPPAPPPLDDVALMLPLLDESATAQLPLDGAPAPPPLDDAHLALSDLDDGEAPAFADLTTYEVSAQLPLDGEAVPVPPPLDAEPLEAQPPNAPARGEVESAALSALRAMRLQAIEAPLGPADEEGALHFGLDLAPTLLATQAATEASAASAPNEAPKPQAAAAPTAEVTGSARAAMLPTAATPSAVAAPSPPRRPPLPSAPEGTERDAHAPSAPEPTAGPMPLAELARQGRADPGLPREPQLTHTGLLLFPIDDVAYLRTDLLVGLAGAFEVEPLNRLHRGRRTDSLFGGNLTPMLAILGDGRSWLDPRGRQVTLLQLMGEELYLVESAVLAFSSGLVWENGHLAEGGSKDLEIVLLRGKGVVAIGSEGAPHSLEAEPGRPVTVHAERLLGWTGSLVPSRSHLPGLPESAAQPPLVRFEGAGKVLGI